MAYAIKRTKEFFRQKVKQRSESRTFGNSREKVRKIETADIRVR